MDIETRRVLIATVIYYLMIGIYYVFSIFPQGRVWGVNWWAYWSDPTIFLLLLCGLIAPVIVWKTLRPLHSLPDSFTRTKHFRVSNPVIMATLVVVFGSTFYLCRASTHFLGDGYLLISRLVADKPFIEPRNYGAMIAPSMLVQHLTGKTLAGATLAYQIMAYLAGTGFVGYILWCGKTLFDQFTDRLQFILLMLTGGHMLLFFGYVENYAPFVLAVAVFTFSGIQIARGHLSRLWMIGLLGICIFFHILGIFLTGAALYLFLPESLRMRINQVPTKVVVLFTIVLFLTGGILYQVIVGKYLLLSLTFLPIVADQFVVEGYTLFSLNHLIDYLNLILILSPPCIMLLSAMPWKRSADPTVDNTIRFLLVLLGCLLLGLFMINPKLGMPRDWDLFAFVGVPLTALFYFASCRAFLSKGSRLYVVVLATTLSMLILGPRIASQMVDQIAITHLNSYMDLDQIKNRPAYQALHTYLKKHELNDRADALSRTLNERQPERSIHKKGYSLFWQGSHKEAIPYFEESIRLNPMYHPAYQYLGFALARLNRFDSAIVVLDIADIMNPNNPVIYFELGMIDFHRREMRLAESNLIRSLEIKSDQPHVRLQLALLYSLEHNKGQFDLLLPSLAGDNGVKPEEFVLLGNLQLKSNDTSRAVQCYRLAIDQGLDSLTKVRLRASFPDLIP